MITDLRYSGIVPTQPPPTLSRRARRRGRPFAEITMACLRVAGPHASMRDWRDRVNHVCEGYGDRAVHTKLQQLQHEGFLTDGLPLTGYLTDKGRRALQQGDD